MTKFACSCAVLLTAFAAGAATCVWTGNGGDYKWSTAENWDTLAVPVDGDNVTLIARRDGVADPTTIVNDIKGLTLNQLKFEGNGSEAASTNITLSGETITLKRTSGSGYNMWYSCYGSTIIRNYCPLVFEESTSGGTSMQGICQDVGLLRQYGDITCSSTYFYLNRVTTTVAEFYGAFRAPSATLKLVYSDSVFYGPVTVDVFYVNDCCPSVWAGEFLAREVRHTGWWNPTLNIYPNGLLEDTSYVFEGSNSRTRLYMRGDIFLSALGGVAPTNETGVLSDASCQRIADENCASVLTLRAVADGESWACLQQKLNFTYAPEGNSTFSFVGRVHTTTGALKVNGGTLRLTQGGCFPNVTDVTVEKGATLDVASKNADNATFSADARLVLATGAKLAVSNGCDFTVKTVVYGGVPVAAGTYTKATCTWLAGEGSVTVTTTGGGATYWKVAADGKWTDADNWTDGVPSDVKPGFVFADGDTDYTVALDETVTAPKIFGLRSGGAGKAILKVTEGGKWLAADVSDYQIGRNATWLVDGGWASVSNNTPVSGLKFFVRGEEGATGAVQVVSGTFKVAIHDQNWMTLGRFGRIDATGGELKLLTSICTQGNPLPYLRGGTITASGSAKLWGNNRETTGDGIFKVGGDVVVGTESYVSPGKTQGLYRFGPYAYANSDGDALWEFTDRSSLSIGGSRFVVGSANVGLEGVFRYSSSARSPASGTLAQNLGVGSYGRGRFYQSNGEIHLSGYGTYVGGGLESDSTSADGYFEVSGGLFCAHSGGANHGEGRMIGFNVGYGAYFNADKTFEDRPFKGLVRVKETGRVYLDPDSWYRGHLVIGAGYGEGRWEQLGGATTNTFCALSVGLVGGIGDLVVSGGVFKTALTYLGGAETNRFTDEHCGSVTGPLLVPKGHYPIDRHAGVGTLTIAGGSFEADFYASWNKTAGVWMGLDGDGVIEMVGSKGAFKATYLTATNLLAGAGTATAHQTESTLKFIFDKDGVSPLDVTGKATLAAGTKVVVDFSDYEGRRHKFRLINAATTEFDPADLDVTFIDRNAEQHGASPATMSLVKDATGLAFKSGKKGVVLMLR